MKAIVSPSLIQGTIQVPASKSAMQRACAAALISKGKTVLHNPGRSADDLAALGIITQLGATTIEVNENIEIESNGVNPIVDTINCGESGLSARMFTSIAATSSQPLVVTGTGSLLKRPFDFFETTYPKLQVSIETNHGLLPLKIQGPLQPAHIEIDGQLSSQFLTGLLFAYAAAGAKGVSINVRNLKSRPYVDLSILMLASFGLNTPLLHDHRLFHFNNQSQEPKNDPFHYTVEADWSSASFLLVAGAIAGEIRLEGLDNFSVQGDKMVLQALMQTGASLSIEPENITVRQGKLKPFHFNATDCPDLFPPLVALAAYCHGTSVIEGVNRLYHKESNRALTLQQEFRKMGVIVDLQDDLMIIKGGGGVKAAEVDAHHDHRIAMACAVAALKADGEMEIEGAEAVNKSYPQFWDHLRQVKAGVTLSK